MVFNSIVLLCLLLDKALADDSLLGSDPGKVNACRKAGSIQIDLALPVITQLHDPLSTDVKNTYTIDSDAINDRNVESVSHRIRA